MSQQSGDQLAPHSIEAEEAVLGSVLINPESLFDAMGFLHSEDFYDGKHSWIWEAMLRLQDRRDPIDYLTVVAELEQAGQLVDVGGAAFILSLINKTPSALNVEGYGRVVERMSLRRKLLEAAGKIARVAHSEDTEIEDVLSEAEANVFDVTRHRIANNNVGFKDVISGEFENLSAIAKSEDKLVGIPSYLIDLDDILLGAKKGKSLIIAARPGMGKSAWLTGIVLQNALQGGKRPGVITLEMDKHEYARRMISSHTGITYQKLENGKLNKFEWKQYTDAMAGLADLPIVINDTPSMNILEVYRTARAMAIEFGIDFLVVDYLQLISGPPTNQKFNRVQEIGAISRALKLIAREFDIPVFTASQLSRAVENRNDKRPILSDLRESGDIEQDADIVMFIYRDSYYHPDVLDPGRTEIRVAKHRGGPKGKAIADWNGPTMTFRNAVEEI